MVVESIRRLFIPLTVIGLLPFAACSGPAPTAIPPTPVPTAVALEARLSDAFFMTMEVARHSFSSYHVELTGTQPLWNPETKSVEAQTIDLRADISGDDIYLLENLQTGTRSEVHEGFIIDGGLKAVPAGKEYEKQAGRLAPSTAPGDIWQALPRVVGLPLFVAAAGSRLAGQETIDGRTVDRYLLDSTKSPEGTTRELGRTISIKQAAATVWLDRQSGALVKMVLDYEQNILDPVTSRQALGRGLGHLELVVSQVGKVTVTLPPLPN